MDDWDFSEFRGCPQKNCDGITYRRPEMRHWKCLDCDRIVTDEWFEERAQRG
jgi:hypothetical protein